MDNPLLYKTITASTQITTQAAWLVGAELHHTGTTDLYIYDEDDSSTTVARKVVSLKGTHETIMFPLPGIKCANGIYAAYLAGTGTIYYHY